MSELEVLEHIGTAAVKRVRKSGQSYLEYPDGTIRIVKVSADSHSFTILAELDADEAKTVRIRHGIA